MTTLRDVAEASGVSIRTVGRALSGDGYVSREVRERVLQTADSLAYRPNLLARNLRLQRSSDVVVIMQSTDELQTARLAGLEQTLRAASHRLLLLLDPLRETPLDDLLADHFSSAPAAVALLLKGFTPEGTDLAEQLSRAEMAYGVLDCEAPGADTIRINRPQGVCEAVHYLAKRGRTRIAYLGTPTQTRVEGYQRALAELGLEPIYLWARDIRDEYLQGRAAGQLLATMTPRPDAVQAHTDVVALGFLAEMH
jgi:DNA-binding LacI/PurR family transcriptional regulator